MSLDEEIGGVIAGPGESATASGFVLDDDDPISALESMAAGDNSAGAAGRGGSIPGPNDGPTE